MGESLKSEKGIRDYLLGRVSDETTLEGVEELLFTDDEFCSRVELAEDGLVNDYVLGRLDEADADSFRATLAANPERRFKLELTRALREKALARAAEPTAKADDDAPTFFDTLKAFFRRPAFAAALAVAVVAALGAAVYFGTRGPTDELAELRAVYRQERPTETRISEFDYAPLAQLRGAAESGARGRLRVIENNLLDAVERQPGAATHHALGVFYLTQQKYEDAVRELTSAAGFDGRSARIHNDLGAARFELAKASAPARRPEELLHALEEFTAATELDAGLLEALFNRSLALQELSMPRQARESWTLYLQKDSASPWAEEARRHLARLGDERSQFKADEDVLADFLAAFRAGDEARAVRIHDATKGLLTTAAVPLQLSRRYLLARRDGDAAAAAESADALAFIGRSERERHAEFFFLNSPATTPASATTRSGRCSKRKKFSPARAA